MQIIEAIQSIRFEDFKDFTGITYDNVIKY